MGLGMWSRSQTLCEPLILQRSHIRECEFIFDLENHSLLVPILPKVSSISPKVFYVAFRIRLNIFQFDYHAQTGPDPNTTTWIPTIQTIRNNSGSTCRHAPMGPVKHLNPKHLLKVERGGRGHLALVTSQLSLAGHKERRIPLTSKVS
jgi:hypothetical protein